MKRPEKELVPLMSDGVVRMRAPEPGDLDMLYLWENDPELWPHGTATAPMSRHALSEYLDNYDGDIFASRQLRLVVELVATGEPVGTVDLSHFNPRDRHARVGVFTAPAHRRAGIATRALGLLLPWAARTLGIHTLVAITACDNEASRALFAGAGFSTCGRIRSMLRRGRSYCDIILYQVLL